MNGTQQVISVTPVVKAAPTTAELLERIAQLEKQAASRPTMTNELRIKIAEKGGISIYGLNARWPVTLYAGQWLRLLTIADKLSKFIEDNRSKLAWKE